MTKLRSGQEMLYKINQRVIIKKRNKVELRFSLPETCIPSMESSEPMVRKLCAGQEMLYKIKGEYIKNGKGRVTVLVARNMHTKYGVIRTYGEKVMRRTRNAL